jgi:plastocyanin
MPIGYVTTANTFQQWLVATQDLITTANNLTNNVAGTFYANTNLIVGNTLNVVGDTTISGNLTVSGNITLDDIGFDDLLVNGSASIANTLSVTGSATLSNTLSVTGSATLSNTLSVTGNTTLSNVAVSGTANISTVISAAGLLSATTNIHVNDWVFSQNANVKSGVTTLSVVNSGSGAYLFDQYTGNNPDIYLHPGQTISFNINAAGHPFLIRQTNNGTLYNVGLTHVSTAGVVTAGSSAQGQGSGTLIWKVPFELSGNTYVYQCQNHAGMVGNLIIQPTVTSVNTTAVSAFAAANAAGDNSLAFAIALG